MKRKILVSILGTAVLLSCFSFSAFAEQPDASQPTSDPSQSISDQNQLTSSDQAAIAKHQSQKPDDATMEANNQKNKAKAVAIQSQRDKVKGLAKKNAVNIVNQADDDNFSWTAPPDMSKEDYLAEMASVTGQTDYYSLSGYNYINYGTIPASGCSAATSGQVQVGFNSTVTNSGNLTYDCKVSGTSSSFYSGITPYYADKIDQADKFTFSIFGLTGATISYPPGLSVSTSSDSAVLTYPTISNAYSYDHTYSGIEGNANFGSSIYNYSQSSATTYLFGTHTISPVCNDSCTIW